MKFMISICKNLTPKVASFLPETVGKTLTHLPI